MKILIIMQGASGSGKSTMALWLQSLIQALGFTCRICSTDKQFEVDGVYKFDPSKITAYHAINQKLVREALERGECVIVDNTNTQAWEARPYVEMAQALGATVLFRPCEGRYQNIHGVPSDKVEQMRARIEPLTVEACLKARAPWEK